MNPARTMTDPRAASSTVLAGPSDLQGEEIVRVEPVELHGGQVLVPAAMPGAPEYRTVSQSELKADQLREEIAGSLDRRGQMATADVRLALDFSEAAGTAVASAGVGLEGYANFHLLRLLPPDSTVDLGSGPKTAVDLRQLPLNERYAKALPALFNCDPPTSAPWWPDLRRIQALAAVQRHGITEPHTRNGLDGTRSLQQRFYHREYHGAAEMMLNAFEHFTPGWIDDQRRQALQLPT